MRQLEFITDVEFVRQKAYSVYNKSENEVEEDIRIIKMWLDTQKHLPEKMKDAQIRNFLLLNKFSIEQAKQKIDMYYTIRNLIPDFYGCSNPKLPLMQKVFNTMNICMHPKLAKDLYRVYMYQIKEPNEILAQETILSLIDIAEIRLHEDYYIYDLHVVDLKNLTFNAMTKFTPTIILNGLAVYEKVFSFRFKACYFINAPVYISKLLAFCKTVMKPKIFERIQICDTDEILKDIFTIDALPKDYGGRGPSLQELSDIARMKFEEYQDRFDELDKLRVNEKLRPKGLKNDDMLGFYGNFKKLNVD